MRGVVSVAIVVICSGSAAFAQSVAKPQTWTATPFLEAAVGTSAPTGSGGLGVGVGYDLTSNLGFEGELSHLFDMSGHDENVDWSVTGVNVNAIYHFDVLRVTPYATVGIGFERSSVHVEPAADAALVPPSSTEVSVNFGGGVKYPLSSRLLVRADLRRFQANDLAPDYWRIYGGLTFTIR